MRTIIACLTVLSLATYVEGQEVSDQQSSSRPFGLDIADKVYEAGSDAASADFQKNVLPEMQSIINMKLTEFKALGHNAGVSLDPDKLKLSTDSQVRVYFVGEGAGYHNTLGFSTDGKGTSGDASLIFPDASTNASYFSYDVNNQNSTKRTRMAPLLPGDFVDLGKFEGGSQLEFFLIANGVYGGTNVWSTDATRNRDGVDHVVAFALEDSPYLLIGFEDLYGGGDRDYNDLLFAVDIGAANVASLSGAPEPGTLMVLGCFAVTGWWMVRRRRLAAART